MRRCSQPEVDQLPPHAAEAERGALGCLILSPETAVADLQEHPDPMGLFYDLRHRKLVEIVVGLADAGRHVDIVAISGRIAELKADQECGGTAYWTEHANLTPSAANLGYYLATLDEYRKRRQLVAACTRIEEAARGPDIGEALALAEQEIFRVAAGTPEANGTSTRDSVLEFISTIEEASKSPGRLQGLSTGLTDMDKLIRGMKAGQLIVVGARPSEGKSALAAQFAERVALDDQLPVGFWSLEMTRVEVVGRIAAGRAHVALAHALEGACDEAELKRMTVSCAQVAAAPLHIYDRPGLSISTLRSMARRFSRKLGLKLIVVDYLGLLHGTERRKDRRDLEIGEITAGLKELAKELGLPVILLSQFNREVEKELREPRLSDLRDSGSIEQDADVVILIQLIQPKHGEKAPDMQRAKLLVRKNRNGPTGAVEVIFNRPLMRFETVKDQHQTITR